MSKKKRYSAWERLQKLKNERAGENPSKPKGPSKDRYKRKKKEWKNYISSLKLKENYKPKRRK